MNKQEAREEAFKKLGFGNLNVLKLPSTTGTFLMRDIDEAIKIAQDYT